MRSILLLKKLLRLVEMTSGLVNVSFSLPEWQAVKMIFSAPCSFYFFSPEKLALLPLLEEIKPSSDCKMIKLLIFC